MASLCNVTVISSGKSHREGLALTWSGRVRAWQDTCASKCQLWELQLGKTIPKPAAHAGWHQNYCRDLLKTYG